MTIESMFLKLVEKFTVQAVDYLKNTDKNLDTDAISEDFEVGLANQVNKAFKFSSNLESFRTQDDRSITENTISLSISNTTRQTFRPLDSAIDFITESNLLNDTKSQLILGDPGSGKTTTLKRLLHETFVLLFEKKMMSSYFLFQCFLNLQRFQKMKHLILILQNK